MNFNAITKELRKVNKELRIFRTKPNNSFVMKTLRIKKLQLNSELELLTFDQLNRKD